jgi:hypothetical protein
MVEEPRPFSRRPRVAGAEVCPRASRSVRSLGLGPQFAPFPILRRTRPGQSSSSVPSCSKKTASAWNPLLSHFPLEALDAASRAGFAGGLLESSAADGASFHPVRPPPPNSAWLPHGDWKRPQPLCGAGRAGAAPAASRGDPAGPPPAFSLRSSTRPPLVRARAAPRSAAGPPTTRGTHFEGRDGRPPHGPMGRGGGALLFGSWRDRLASLDKGGGDRRGKGR